MSNTKTKTKTTSKSTNKTTKTKSYTKVAMGVYQTPSGSYRARKTINGKTISGNFSNKTKAIAFYKGL